MSGRGRRLVWTTRLLAVTAVAVGSLFVPIALAVHGVGLFELDGDAVDSGGSGLPQDWNTFSQPPAVAKVFETDPFESETDDIFTTGGSKDDLPISSWRWKEARPSPDKDDLEHAFASAYVKNVGGNDHLFLYFGADRFAVNGSANLGFWFFQDEVGLVSGDPGTFTGAHGDADDPELQVGDLFVASEFTNGGTVPRIVVYEWVGSGGSDGALNKIASNGTSGAFCNPADGLPADSVCAIVNSSTKASPWDYFPKAPGTTIEGDFPAGAFFEGGIDLTALFGGGLPCITSFLASTRTSFEPDSELKDFVAGDFNLCSQIIVDKVTDPSGSAQSFAFSVTGGPDAISQVFSLTDQAQPHSTGLVKAGSGYAVTETLPAGWQLVGATCNDGSPAANVSLQPGETVTCTFTNRKTPTLTVNKVVIPASDPGKFNLRIDGATAGTGANVGNGGTTGPVQVAVGSHTVSETAGTGTSLANFTTVIGGDCSADGSVTLAAGQNKVCAITNTRKGAIRIVKETLPDGDPTEFVFTGDVSGTLSDGESATQTVAPGSYTSTESPLVGWDLTQISCDDANSSGNISTGVAAFNVEAGETVTCTFTNTKRGRIVIDKVTSPAGNSTSFAFTLSGGPSNLNESFSLADADAPHSTGLIMPGSGYAAAETVPAGWVLSASCDDGSPVGNIDVAPGETVTCTFTNTNQPNVRVVKTADESPISAGETASFTITVTNQGPGTATGVTLSDELPAGVSWALSGADAGSCSIDTAARPPDVLTCNFGSIVEGASRTVAVSGATDAADCGTLLNTAIVSAANEPASNQGDNSSSATVIVQCPALSVVKTADDASVTAGGQIGFTIVVSNGSAPGTGTAANVTLDDALPGGSGVNWSIDAAGSDAGCSITGDPPAETLGCAFGDLAPGASKAVHVTSPTTTAGCIEYPNTASAQAVNHASVEARASLSVVCPPAPAAAPAPKVIDLRLTKMDLVDPVSVGDEIVYTIPVTNDGPDDATGVIVTDVLPGEVSFVSASSTVGSCVPGEGIVTCKLGAMAKGAQATITIVVVADVAGTALNEAVVVGNEAESNTANNRDSEVTTIIGPFTPPSVCATLTASVRSLTVGKRTAIRVVVRDQRGKAMRGVRVYARGAGIRAQKATTNAKGVARLVVTPQRTGILRIAAPANAKCAKRVGVMGVFQPPVTG